MAPDVSEAAESCVEIIPHEKKICGGADCRLHQKVVCNEHFIEVSEGAPTKDLSEESLPMTE